MSSGATAATTNANDFVLCLTQNTSEIDPGTGTLTAGTGYTKNGTAVHTVAESKSVSATGAQTGTWTQSVNHNRTTQVIAFKEAATSPTINTQPADQYVYAGQVATFTISATTSGGTLHYQWKDDGANVGTDSSTYAPTAAVGDNGSIITCVVSDDNGSTTSMDAHLFVAGVAATMWWKA